MTCSFPISVHFEWEIENDRIYDEYYITDYCTYKLNELTLVICIQNIINCSVD